MNNETLSTGILTASARPKALDHLVDDQKWMLEALKLAYQNAGVASPNPTVGCVVVKNGKMLSSGATQAYGGSHAERVALSSCHPSELEGSTLYVTLEPCSHHGKTPPCCELVASSGIKRVVIACQDSFEQVDGQGIQYLKKHGIEVELGILEAEAVAWHLPFLFHSKFKRPLIAAKWAQTLDGHLADDHDSSQWISRPESRQYVHQLRQKYDLILVGAGTAIADSPRLDVRDAPQVNRHPMKAIYDPKAYIPAALNDKLLSSTFKGRGIYIGPASDQIPESWQQIPWDQAPSLALFERLNQTYLEMSSYPLQSVFVEGGPKLLNSLHGLELVDVIHCFIRPGLVGGTKNRIGQTGPGQGDLKQLVDYDSIVTEALGGDILCEAYRPGLTDEL